MVPQELFAEKNEVDLSIELINGSRIELKGGDRYDSLRGNSLSNVILDEAAYIPPDCWEMVIRPALADQRGDAILYRRPAGASTISMSGTSRLSQSPLADVCYNTIEGGNVPPEEVELARRTLDERTFRQEFEASFQSFSGLVFPEFSEENIYARRGHGRPDPGRPGFQRRRDGRCDLLQGW